MIAGPGLAAGNTVVPFGNFIAKAAVRQLNHEHPGLGAIWVQPLAAASRDLASIFESAGDDVHAGEVETSFMLALCPDAVGQAPEPGHSRRGSSGPLRGRRGDRGLHQGYAGDPRRDEEVGPLPLEDLGPQG